MHATRIALLFAFRPAVGDAARIVTVQADALDKNYLRRWAEKLKVASELERLLGGEIKPKNT